MASRRGFLRRLLLRGTPLAVGFVVASAVVALLPGGTTDGSRDAVGAASQRRQLIIGGSPVGEDDRYGFFVHFEGSGLCGGSLIAPGVVLTAGHCWSATLGEIIIDDFYDDPAVTIDNDNNPRPKKRIGRVAEYRIHPEYNVARKFDNDFLLLRLSSLEVVEREDRGDERPENYVEGGYRDDFDTNGGGNDRENRQQETTSKKNTQQRNTKSRGRALHSSTSTHAEENSSGDGTDPGGRRRRLGYDSSGGAGGSPDTGHSHERDGLSYIELNPDPDIPADYGLLNLLGMGYVNAMDEAETLHHIQSQTPSSSSSSSAASDTLVREDGRFRKIPFSVCNGPESYDGAIHEDTMLCAGSMEGGRDACMGDSGGPLFYYRQHDDDDDENRGGRGRPVLVGLVSWGRGCGLPNLPSAYARVSSAYDWIRSVVCGDWKRKASRHNGGESTDGGGGDDNGDDDWFLCRDYDYEPSPPQNPLGGPDGGLRESGCDNDTEASLDFRLTSDAYGWETSWELRSIDDGGASGSGDYYYGDRSGSSGGSPNAGTTRLAGDQLFNVHETRSYRYCLHRGGPATDGNNPGSQQSNTDPPPGENRGSDNDYPLGRIGRPCYVLDVYDRMNDGMVHETKIDSNPGGSDDDDDDDNGLAGGVEEAEAAAIDPAGFGISFGTAEEHRDFSFPGFGSTQTFLLCPGEDRNEKDSIVVVTEAPTAAPTWVFPEWVPLRVSALKKDLAEPLGSGLRGRIRGEGVDGDASGGRFGNGRNGGGWMQQEQQQQQRKKATEANRRHHLPP